MEWCNEPIQNDLFHGSWDHQPRCWPANDDENFFLAWTQQNESCPSDKEQVVPLEFTSDAEGHQNGYKHIPLSPDLDCKPPDDAKCKPIRITESELVLVTSIKNKSIKKIKIYLSSDSVIIQSPAKLLIAAGHRNSLLIDDCPCKSYQHEGCSQMDDIVQEENVVSEWMTPIGTPLCVSYKITNVSIRINEIYAVRGKVTVVASKQANGECIQRCMKLCSGKEASLFPLFYGYVFDLVMIIPAHGSRIGVYTPQVKRLSISYSNAKTKGPAHRGCIGCHIGKANRIKIASPPDLMHVSHSVWSRMNVATNTTCGQYLNHVKSLASSIEAMYNLVMLVD